MNNNNWINWNRVIAIAQKEFFHIFRDKFTMGLALVLPLIVVFLFGVAIEFNQREIPLGVFDQDKTQSSRELVDVFSSSGFFKVQSVYNISHANSLISSETVTSVIVIPPHFQRDFRSGKKVDVQLLLNAADNQAASSTLNYLTTIQTLANKRMNPKKEGHIQPTTIQFESRFLFNPELNSKWFTVPGLLVTIMTMIAILLTALTVAKEWESGSMELLLSTPVKSIEIIIGKMAPYAILCFSAVIIVYLAARLLFGVPFVGSHITYMIGCFFFLMTYLAQGLMISVLTRRQMLAMQLSIILGLLPSQLLSGFIFPIENMPTFFRILTGILPARWFMNISRLSFLQGASFWQMKVEIFSLMVLMLIFSGVALLKFKKDLEP